MSDTGTSSRKRTIRPSKRLSALAGEGVGNASVVVNARMDKVRQMQAKVNDPAFDLDEAFQRAAARMMQVEFA